MYYLSRVAGDANCFRIAPIYIGNRSPINTANNEPARELLTWMRVLTVCTSCTNSKGQLSKLNID